MFLVMGGHVADLVLLKVPLDEDSDEFVEVQVARSQLAGLSDEGVVLASDGDDRFEATSYTFAGAVGRVIPALRKIVANVRDGVQAPDELTMEVGLMIGGETGIIFAKGTVEANFTLTMTWRRGEAE